jgi:hypothetical protein
MIEVVLYLYEVDVVMVVPVHSVDKKVKEGRKGTLAISGSGTGKKSKLEKTLDINFIYLGPL